MWNQGIPRIEYTANVSEKSILLYRITISDPYEQGKATVTSMQDRTNSVSLILKREFNEGLLTTYKTYTYVEGVYTLVGAIAIEFFSINEHGNYEGEKTRKISESSQLMRYGLDETAYKANKIFVEDLFSSHRQHLHGVGTALMQAAIEYSYSKGCDGRILLEASPAAHVFYFKLGMRTLDPALDALIEQEWNEPSKPRELIYMYMPAAARLMWKERIKLNPIFSETIQLLGEKS